MLFSWLISGIAIILSICYCSRVLNNSVSTILVFWQSTKGLSLICPSLLATGPLSSQCWVNFMQKTRCHQMSPNSETKICNWATVLRLKEAILQESWMCADWPTTLRPNNWTAKNCTSMDYICGEQKFICIFLLFFMIWSSINWILLTSQTMLGHKNDTECKNVLYWDRTSKGKKNIRLHTFTLHIPVIVWEQQHFSLPWLLGHQMHTVYKYSKQMRKFYNK